MVARGRSKRKTGQGKARTAAQREPIPGGAAADLRKLYASAARDDKELAALGFGAWGLGLKKEDGDE